MIKYTLSYIMLEYIRVCIIKVINTIDFNNVTFDDQYKLVQIFLKMSKGKTKIEI